MMRYLVTGASGFVGSALAWELRLRHGEVGAILRDAAAVPGATHTFRGELEDMRVCERAIAEFQPDIVYHLGAQAMVGVGNRDPWSTFESNVRGTYNILEAFRRYHKKGSAIVVASSDKAYGELQPGKKAYTETDPLRGVGPYDCSKSCADMIAQSYAEQYWLRTAIVRCGNIYGPGDTDLSRIVPSLASDLVNYKTMTIRSDGTPVRDYTYISDVVNAYVRIGHHMFESDSGFTVPAAYNVAGHSPVSVIDLATKMRSVFMDMGIHIPGRMPSTQHVIRGERVGEIQTQVLDTSKIERELGFKPEVTLDAGLRHTLSWWYNGCK